MARKPAPKKQPAKRGPGRPSKFTPQLADEICRRLSEGQGLRTICLDKRMPDRGTVLRWEEQDSDFAAKCARARDYQADWIFDDIANMENGILAGEITPEQGRVVIGSKQWRAGRLAPKRYGDKTQIDANVTMSWASIVEEVAAKRLAEAKTIEGEIISDPVEKCG